MKVFVTGATGVLGRRTVPLLLAAGHDVTAVARRADQRDALGAIGAGAVTVDLFDREAVADAVAGHEVVVNLATSIPSGAGAAEPGAWELNHRLRRDASRHLVEAALETGVSRFVQESLGLLYADGADRPIAERAPLDPAATTDSSLDAEAQADRFGRWGDAVVLRFATFYGPDSAHTRQAIAAARRGVAAALGPLDTYRSWVTTDDAAAAVVAALHAAPGTYNVADDEPLHQVDFFDALAAALGRGALVPAPGFEAAVDGLAEPLTRSLRISNAKLRGATGWRPGSPSAREGRRAVVEAAARDGS